MDHSNVIVVGFGQRLREERKRLGLSQVKFAELAHVKRVSQSQYESEITAPTIRYLSAIAEAGVDISYLLFGKARSKFIAPGVERKLKVRALSLLDKYVQLQCDGQLGVEVRAAILDVIMALLSDAAHKGAEAEDSAVLELLSNH
jgi:transcriptional regulator with XRE-family HTH domain